MKLIEHLISSMLIGIIKTYKYLISPLLGPNCRFLPTCSDYFIESIQKKRFFKWVLFRYEKDLKMSSN